MMPGSASVKMSAEAKDHLEQLQAAIKLETGRKVTQQELLTVIVEHALATREELFEHFRDDWEPLTPEEIERFNEGTEDWGIETSYEEVDDLLYGEDAP